MSLTSQRPNEIHLTLAGVPVTFCRNDTERDGLGKLVDSYQAAASSLDKAMAVIAALTRAGIDTVELRGDRAHPVIELEGGDAIDALNTLAAKAQQTPVGQVSSASVTATTGWKKSQMNGNGLFKI